MEDVAFGVVQGLFMLLSFALWLLPIAFAVWVLIRMSAMSRDLGVMKRQLAAIADHSGAPVVPQPPEPRSARAPLWGFAIVLLVFLLVVGLMFVVPGLSSSGMGADTELRRAPGPQFGGSDGSMGSSIDPPPLPAPLGEPPGPG